LHQRLQADGAVGAGAVFDEYLLPEPLGEMPGGKARDEVGAASRRERAIILIARCGQVWIGACAPAAPGNAPASASAAASVARSMRMFVLPMSRRLRRRDL
jgi:hypothetical protein